MKNSDSLKGAFQKASKDIMKLSEKPTNEHLLCLYALYKQGSFGDNRGKKPGMLNIKARKKFEAWDNLKGMSKEKAMQKYVELVENLGKRS